MLYLELKKKTLKNCSWQYHLKKKLEVHWWGTTVSSTDTHSEFYSVQIELVYLSFG